jgi:large subunit ribosomal protein L21
MAAPKTQKNTAEKAPKAVTKKAAPKAKATGSEEFAVIFTGGKQYQVAVGDTVMIEKLPKTAEGNYKKGDMVSFDKVLLVDNGTDTTIGTPYITGAVVDAEVAVVGREQKVTVIKYKQKSRYFKKNGHRQPYLKVTITAIK